MIAAVPPEIPQRPPRPGDQLDFAPHQRPPDHSADIVKFSLDFIEPDLLFRPIKVGGRSFQPLQVKGGVPPVDFFGFIAPIQELQAVLADRLQHREARLASALYAPQQALIDQARDAVLNP